MTLKKISQNQMALSPDLIYESLIQLQNYAHALEWKMDQLYPEGRPNEPILTQVNKIVNMRITPFTPEEIQSLNIYNYAVQSIQNTLAKAAEYLIMQEYINAQR